LDGARNTSEQKINELRHEFEKVKREREDKELNSQNNSTRPHIFINKVMQLKSQSNQRSQV